MCQYLRHSLIIRNLKQQECNLILEVILLYPIYYALVFKSSFTPPPCRPTWLISFVFRFFLNNLQWLSTFPLTYACEWIIYQSYEYKIHPNDLCRMLQQWANQLSCSNSRQHSHSKNIHGTWALILITLKTKLYKIKLQDQKHKQQKTQLMLQEADDLKT